MAKTNGKDSVIEVTVDSTDTQLSGLKTWNFDSELATEDASDADGPDKLPGQTTWSGTLECNVLNGDDVQEALEDANLSGDSITIKSYIGGKVEGNKVLTGTAYVGKWNPSGTGTGGADTVSFDLEGKGSIAKSTYSAS